MAGYSTIQSGTHGRSLLALLAGHLARGLLSFLVYSRKAELSFKTSRCRFNPLPVPANERDFMTTAKTKPKDRVIYDTKVKALIRRHYGEALVTKEFLTDLNEHVRRVTLDSLEHPDNQQKFVKTLCVATGKPAVTRVKMPPPETDVSGEAEGKEMPIGSLKVNPKAPQDIMVYYKVHIQDVELTGVYAVRTAVSLDEIRNEKAQLRVRTQLANIGVHGWQDAIVLVTDIKPYTGVVE